MDEGEKTRVLVTAQKRDKGKRENVCYKVVLFYQGHFCIRLNCTFNLQIYQLYGFDYSSKK